MKKYIALLILALAFALQLNAQSVWGYVYYFNNPIYPIDGVTVQLYDMSGQLLATTSTNGDGYYIFNNVQGTNFKIKAVTNLPGYQANIVSANEILQFLNGQIEFSSWQYIAADVDGNGVVDMNDYQFVAVNHYLFGEPFPAGNWLFSEAQIDLIVNAGGGPSNLGGSRISDIEGIYIPTGRDSYEPNISFSNVIVPFAAQGTEVVIPVELSLQDGISAYGIALSFNPELLEILSVDAGFGFGGYHVRDGLLRISSLGAGIRINETINIRVRLQNAPVGTFQPFNILSESHVINGMGNKAVAFAAHMPLIGNESTKPSITLMPNPVAENTTVSFNDVPAGIYQLML